MKPSKPQPPRPTQAELEILRVLWQRGPSSVREAQQTLAETREMGYTTVLKLLQILAAKGLALRARVPRLHHDAARSDRPLLLLAGRGSEQAAGDPCPGPTLRARFGRRDSGAGAGGSGRGARGPREILPALLAIALPALGRRS